jgi:energy-coupling factor transporter ATP-binding protein EcfA2
MLDTTRLKAELGNIQAHLARVITGPRGGEVVRPLRQVADLPAPPGRLLWQALHNDCLRVIYVAINADDRVADEEIEDTYEYLFSVARHYAELLPAAYGVHGALEPETAREFLACYAADRGPFGFRGDQTRWAGLDACRRAAVIGDDEPLERYMAMIGWLCDEAIRIAGVELNGPRPNAKLTEIEDLRQALAQRSKVSAPGTDLRLEAFLSGPRVFAAITHADSVFEEDPFDVEEVHAEVRETFERMVGQAIDRDAQPDRGRILLVLGDSGAGKTHLMRAFRSYVHRGHHGFAVYAQLQSRAPEYGHYLLHNVIESLERRYGARSDDASGLLELARGLSRFLSDELQASVARLAEDDWESGALATHVNRLVDELLAHDKLARFDPDLLRVLLYLQCDDSRITTRALKYLRCEPMNTHDLAWIGDVMPKVGADEPIWMIQRLARLAFVTQDSAFVIMVDQAELAGFDGHTIDAFKRAVDALYAVASAVPSVVVVVACLTDMYRAAEPELSRGLLDRLTTDPPRAVLAMQRTAPEITSIVARRLEWLYGDTGAVFRREDATYPLPVALLNAVVGFRTRSVLDMCHKFQQECSAAGRLVDAGSVGVEELDASTDDGVRVEDLDRLATEWNDYLHTARPEVPDDDEGVLALLGEAAQACQVELGWTTVVRSRETFIDADLGNGDQRQQLTIGVTNKSARGGHFGRQLEHLCKASGGRTPAAVRTVAFPTGTASEKRVADLLRDGGRKVLCSEGDLRSVLAMRAFAKLRADAPLDAWRRRDRPLLRREGLAELFAATSSGVLPPPPKPVVSVPRPNPPTPVPKLPPIRLPIPVATTGVTTPGGELHVGTTVGLDPRPLDVSVELLVRHSGVLGSPGSGKTTLALNLVEQLLEHDIAVVLVDRKGDLAGYARPDWFESIPDHDQRARGKKLADRIDVRLFTPGTGGGRSLGFGVVPRLDGVPDHERSRVVIHATGALAAMLRLGSGVRDQTRRAILSQAIMVLSERVAPAGLGRGQLRDHGVAPMTTRPRAVAVSGGPTTSYQTAIAPSGSRLGATATSVSARSPPSSRSKRAGPPGGAPTQRAATRVAPPPAMRASGPSAGPRCSPIAAETSTTTPAIGARNTTRPPPTRSPGPAARTAASATARSARTSARVASTSARSAARGQAVRQRAHQRVATRDQRPQAEVGASHPRGLDRDRRQHHGRDRGAGRDPIAGSDVDALDPRVGGRGDRRHAVGVAHHLGDGLGRRADRDRPRRDLGRAGRSDDGARRSRGRRGRRRRWRALSATGEQRDGHQPADRPAHGPSQPAPSARSISAAAAATRAAIAAARARARPRSATITSAITTSPASSAASSAATCSARAATRRSSTATTARACSTSCWRRAWATASARALTSARRSSSAARASAAAASMAPRSPPGQVIPTTSSPARVAGPSSTRAPTSSCRPEARRAAVAARWAASASARSAAARADTGAPSTSSWGNGPRAARGCGGASPSAAASA